MVEGPAKGETMIAKARILALMIGALLAVGAIADGASASKIMSEGNVEADYGFKQVETEVHGFTIDGSSLECELVFFETEALVASPTSTLSLVPDYNGECAGFGFLNASAETTGCEYILTAGSQQSTDVFAGSVKVSCSGGKQVVLTAGTCEAKIASSTVMSSGITLTNMTPGEITLKFASAPFAVNKTKDGFLCPFSGTGATTGTYSGNTRGVAAKSGGAFVNVTVEP